MKSIEIVKERIDELKKYWEAEVGGTFKIEIISNNIYAYGSELSCLRLFKKLLSDFTIKDIDVNYSSNLKTWYFKKIIH